MRRFLPRLLAFLSIATVGCVLLFAAVVMLNRQAVTSCRLGDGVDSVIIGDSHTAWAINDAGIDGLRNVSLNAEGYKYTYEKLKYLVKAEPGIKRIFLGFSYHNLSGYYDEYIYGKTFSNFVERYLPILTLKDYADLLARNPLQAPDFVLRIFRHGFSPGIKSTCLLYGRFAEVPMVQVFDRAAMERRLTEQYKNNGRLWPESASNIEYLGKIIRLSQDYSLDLVMLNTPLHPEYRKRIPAEYVYSYEQYLAEHRLRSFDFSDLKLADEHFLPDGDHVNYSGAVLVSRRFQEYLRQIRLGSYND